MANIVVVLAVVLLLVGSLATRSYLIALIGLPLYLLIGFLVSSLIIYVRELISGGGRPPIAGPIVNLLIYFNSLFDYQSTLARKWPTFRLIRDSHSEIFTADPINIEYILKTNFPNYGKGQYNFDIMKDLFGDGIFAVDGDKWRHQRKLASYEFSAKVLRDFSSAVFRSNASKLALRVSIEAVAGREMDLQDLLMKSTMDSMFKVGFGIDLDTLSGSDDISNQFIKAFDDSNVIVYWRYVDVFWKIKRFLNISQERALRNNIKIIDDFVYKLIHHKRKQMNKTECTKEDILSRFLEEGEKDREKMTDKYLRDIILNFLIAGKDSSANTLAWFFYMLCKHPQVQEKVVQEVALATEVAAPFSIVEFVPKLTDATLDRMHYLHAALTETLRLYPAVPVDGKCSNEDDILPDGHKVKKGDGISYMPYAMGRMTYLWGEDAVEFRPERWLENGIFQAESPFKFTAFQAGPRICLGKEFAYRQMKILASTLVFFFRFQLVDETKEATYRTMFTLHMDKGLPVFASQRYHFDFD
uniref:Cytochrome P450 n=1 Tax=Scoparia dulcis TaxID=107240 RepID=A0A1W7HBV9_SCODU